MRIQTTHGFSKIQPLFVLNNVRRIARVEIIHTSSLMGAQKGKWQSHETSMGISYCASMRSSSLSLWWYKPVCRYYWGKCMEFAPHSREYLKVIWICCPLSHTTRIRSPQALWTCACALSQPRRSLSDGGVVSHWCIIHLKKSFLPLWKNHHSRE